MQEYILPYILGVLIAQGISTIWFFSGFPLVLFSKLRILKKSDEVYTQEEWELWIASKSDFFGELLTCPICLSVWIALTVSATMYYIADYSPLFIVSAVLSWPFLMFLFFKKLENE